MGFDELCNKGFFILFKALNQKIYKIIKLFIYDLLTFLWVNPYPTLFEAMFVSANELYGTYSEKKYSVIFVT